MRYQVKHAELEAFQLDDGSYVVITANGPEIRQKDEFEALFEPAPDRRTKRERRKDPRKTCERRSVTRATRRILTPRELGEIARMKGAK